MNDCEYFEQLCSNSIDGTLTDDERLALDAHLAECPACARLMDELTQMRQLFMAETEVPDSLHESIMERVEQEVRLTVVQPEKRTHHVPVFTMAAAAAVVVMIVLSGGFSQFFGGKSSTVPEAGNPVTADAGETTGKAARGVPDAPMQQSAPVQTQDAPDVQSQDTAFGTQADMGKSQDVEQVPTLQSAPQEASDGQPRIAAYGGDEAAIQLPDEIQGMSVAYCYVATGTGELPDLNSTPLVVNGSESYFALENNMNFIEKTLDSIEKAGYSIAAHEDIALVNDPKAETWLLIVRNQ